MKPFKGFWDLVANYSNTLQITLKSEVTVLKHFIPIQYTYIF